MWIKRARISTSNSHTSMSTWGGHSGSGSGRGYGMVNDYTGTINGMSFEDNNGSSWHVTTRTSAVYRDLSAWTHVCWRYDSTQSTASDRARMYVNGELITDLQATTYPAQNADHSWNSGGYQFIGCNLTASNGNNPHQGFDGYIAEVVSIDGTSLDPMDNLVETKNGVIIPKDPSGLTFGTNGFWLKFTNSSALGEDFSGNDNDFTVAGIAAHDQMLDTPTFNSSSNGGNFATLGPLWKTDSVTFSEGNLKATSTTNNVGAMSNWQVPLTGKWYWEVIPTFSSGHAGYVGVMPANTDLTINQESNNLGLVYYSHNGNSILKGTRSSYGDTWTSGDVIGVAVDRSADTIQFYKNGSAQGSAIDVSSLDSEFFPYLGFTGGTGTQIMNFNFGQDGTFAGETTAGGNSDTNGYGNCKDRDWETSKS